MTDADLTTASPRAPSLMSVLYIPWVDKLFAIVALIPFIIDLYDRWLGHNVSFARAVLGLNVVVLIVTMAFRKTAVRITPNLLFWLLAWVASYGTLAISVFAQRGIPLVPPMVSNALAMASVLVLVWARLSLGRSMGMLPAQRVIITDGAYRFVRHPIYSGLFLSHLGFILRAFSAANVAMVATSIALFVIKSVIEERFLRSDAAYAGYLERVHWRWFPGLA